MREHQNLPQYIYDTGSLKCIDEFEITKYTGKYDKVEEAKYDIPPRIFSNVRADREYADTLTLLSSLGIIEKTPLFILKKAGTSI